MEKNDILPINLAYFLSKMSLHLYEMANNYKPQPDWQLYLWSCLKRLNQKFGVVFKSTFLKIILMFVSVFKVTGGLFSPSTLLVILTLKGHDVNDPSPSPNMDLIISFTLHHFYKNLKFEKVQCRSLWLCSSNNKIC